MGRSTRTLINLISSQTVSGWLGRKWCILTSPLWKTAKEYPLHTSYTRLQIYQALSYIGNRRLYKMIPYRGTCFPLTPRGSFEILKELTVDTDAETCMKGKFCGQEAVLLLQNHYYGKSEGKRRKQVANHDIHMLFYKNETTFSFEKYVTKMKNIHVLEHYKRANEGNRWLITTYICYFIRTKPLSLSRST